MSFLPKDETVSLVNIRLTEKGREFLAQGFKMDNVFDIVKFSLGDSEIDYTDPLLIANQIVLEPMTNPVDLKSKLYASGVVPDGIPQLTLGSTSISMTKYQSGVQNNVSTQWDPIDGKYIEEYSWLNLGPLEDYDFGMTKSSDSSTITIRAFDTTGSTTIKVQGMTSGEYSLFTLNIT